jgi:hypothetical protein
VELDLDKKKFEKIMKTLYEYFKAGLSIDEACLLYFKHSGIANDFKTEYYDLLEQFREIALIEKKFELSKMIEDISERKNNLQGLLFKYAEIDKEYYNLIQEKKKKLTQEVKNNQELKELFYEIKNSNKQQ